MTIKRYDPVDHGTFGNVAIHGAMEECPDGDYVKLEDVHALIATIRDAVLHERYQLAELPTDPDVINAVLGIIDDNTPS